MRSAALFALYFGALFVGGCTRSRSSSSANGEAGAVASATSVASASLANAIFSAPIAATHQKGGAVFFAGYVATRNAFALTRVEQGGGAAWTVDAITNLRWSSDADVHVFAAPDGGAYVVARGIRDKKFVREIAALSTDGKLRAPAEAMSGDACGTTDGLASLRGDGKRMRATLRNFDGAAPHDLFPIRTEGEHEIVCGDHTAFVVTHDDAVTVERAGAPPIALLGEHDPSDNFEEFTAGDDFGAINVANGEISVREANARRTTSWRAIGRLPEGGDVVGADADTDDIYVLYTQETRDFTCDAGGSTSRLTALDAPRSSGDAHVRELSSLPCDSDDGPFFTGFSHKNGAHPFFVAWPERRTPKSDEAPIAALAYVVVDHDHVSEVKRVPVDADALVDAGCDDDGCYAAALVRVTGTDGMVPGPARILRYPQ